jgi:integrase
MGLTKRRDSYYVEFPVRDDGRTLTLARGSPGANLKRWKVGSLNKTLAKQQEAMIKTDLLKGVIKSEQIEAPKTFSQWAAEYLQIEEVRRLRSYRERSQRIEKVLKPLFGKKLLPDLTVRDIEEFRNVRGVGRALSTVNVDHTILRHMLKHAMKRDLVGRNVASLVAAPKPKNARDRVLEPDEWERLSKAVPPWFQPVLIMGYHTGMRLNEILGMHWEWVDLEKKRIYLPGEATKTGLGREVPMTPTVARLLHALRGQGGVVRMKGLVFLKMGKRITHSYRIVMNACKETKIENFVFHDLRHCAVTNLADAGVDTETIMKIVGHSSVDMFLRYRAIKPEKLDAAMDRLNTLITRGREAVI